MLKQLLLTLAILTSVMGFISCSKDEPNNGGKDPIENPSDDPKDDPSDDPTDDPTQDPTADGTVTVSADGTASNGMQFRRINETEFMLNYVRYGIYDGHLEVNGHDEIEIMTSLKGKVKIVPAVILDGTKYYTRYVGNFSSSKLKEIELPNTVTGIYDYAFAGAKSLEAIRIPDSVTKIDSNAFYGCTSLSSVELNEGLETLGPQAFYGCSKLEKISIPENVSIYYNAFHYVPLKELRLPGTIKIEGGSYYGDIVFNSKELKDIYVNSKIPIKPEEEYYKLFEDIILYEAYLHVPKGSSDLYKQSPFWGNFINIVEYNPK